MYMLTETGKGKAIQFIEECEALKKEILDGKKDVTYNTPKLPTINDILYDMEFWNCDKDYYGVWGITDNYDLSIHLENNIDLKKVIDKQNIM